MISPDFDEEKGISGSEDSDINRPKIIRIPLFSQEKPRFLGSRRTSNVKRNFITSNEQFMSFQIILPQSIVSDEETSLDRIKLRIDGLRTEIPSIIPLRETSLERIERKLDQLRIEVATKEDIINSKNELIQHIQKLLDNQKKLNKDLQNEIILSKPAVRWLRTSLIVMAVCLFSLIAWFYKGFLVINPIISSITLIIAVGFFIMSLLFQKEWRSQIKEVSKKKTTGEND